MEDDYVLCVTICGNGRMAATIYDASDHVMYRREFLEAIYGFPEGPGERILDFAERVADDHGRVSYPMLAELVLEGI